MGDAASPSDHISWRAADYVCVTVSDAGTGFTVTDREVLEGRQETPIVHGEGLSLVRVLLVTSAVGGWMAAEADDGITSVLVVSDSTTIAVGCTPLSIPKRMKYTVTKPEPTRT
jgi:hypothetical protein